MNNHQNISLWIGVTLISCFAIVALIGPYVTPYETTFEKMLNFEGAQVSIAPEPPTADHLFGKDRYGRDLLSLMLVGLKYTLFTTLAIALCRLFIGGVLGLILGMGTNKKFQKPSSPFNWLSCIPLVLVLYTILEVTRSGYQAPIWRLVLLQSVIMVLFGIPSITATIQQKTQELRHRLSVSVSIILGASKIWIIRKHIFPFLKENFIILFVQEMISVLNVIGQLSLLQIFLGGTILKKDLWEQQWTSRTFEWLGLLGENKNMVIVYPWLVAFPLTAYLLLLFSFYLLSKGLEKKFQIIYHKQPHL